MTVEPVPLLSESPDFPPFLEAARGFWERNLLPDGERVILVEAMSQDVRVTLRNLTVANALRRFMPAKLVVYTGTDDDWTSILWTYFDAPALRALSEAYGASDVVDIHQLVDEHLASGLAEVVLGGTRVPLAEEPGIDPDVLEEVVHATACRVLRVPRVPEADRESEKYQEIRERSARFSRVYDAFFRHLQPLALVTSHVDYNHWGLAVEAAQRAKVPTVFVQSTGSCKAYAWFPEKARGEATFRAELTQQIAEYFEEHVWGNREVLHAGAELTAWRAKGNLGRPSWWRGGGAISAVELGSVAERESVRRHVLARHGFDPDKPVVAVYNHAVSDALGTNVELFDDLGSWFEETAAWAATRTDANWLFVDHPQQLLYDATGFFAGIAARHADADHLRFVRSLDLSKNAMWSVIDLGITVRGSISNELPSYGIPAVQAGWSEWSHCGFTMRADSREGYFAQVGRAIDALYAGTPLVTDEQLERARLWTWFYRSGADVATPLVPHWEMGKDDELLRALTVALRHVEPDGDPVLLAARRMWQRREPFLTRVDLTLRGEPLVMALGGMGDAP